MTNALHRHWDGDGSFKQWLRRKENITKIENKIRSLIIENKVTNIKINTSEKYAIIIYNDDVTREEMFNASDILIKNDLMSYIV
jgi:phage anti-repressor protein